MSLLPEVAPSSGRVSFVGASGMAVVQHPALGRLTIANAGEVKLDDQVVIDSSSRDAGNVIKVMAWHRSGASNIEQVRSFTLGDALPGPAARQAEPAVEIPRDDVSPALDLPPQPKGNRPSWFVERDI